MASAAPIIGSRAEGHERGWGPLSRTGLGTSVQKMNKSASLAEIEEREAAVRAATDGLADAMRRARAAGHNVRAVARAARMSIGKAHTITTTEGVLGRALEAPGNAPVIRRVALISGGGDSTVLAHRCREFYDEL